MMQESAGDWGQGQQGRAEAPRQVGTEHGYFLEWYSTLKSFLVLDLLQEMRGFRAGGGGGQETMSLKHGSMPERKYMPGHVMCP